MIYLQNLSYKYQDSDFFQGTLFIGLSGFLRKYVK